MVQPEVYVRGQNRVKVSGLWTVKIKPIISLMLLIQIPIQPKSYAHCNLNDDFTIQAII